MRDWRPRRGEIAGWELVGLAVIVLCGAAFFHFRHRDAGYRECSQCGGDGYVDKKDIDHALKEGVRGTLPKKGYCPECQPMKALQARNTTPVPPGWGVPPTTTLPPPGSQPSLTSGLRAGSQAPRNGSWQRQAAQEQAARSRYAQQAQRDYLQRNYGPMGPARTSPPDWIPYGQTSGGWRYMGRSGFNDADDCWNWVDGSGRVVGPTIVSRPL